MGSRAGRDGREADGGNAPVDAEAPAGRFVVTDGNLRSAWVTGAAFLVIAYLEGFAFAPMLAAAGVPLGPAMYYLLNAQLDETQRGLATFGAVGAFVAAVLLGHLEGAVWVALGVDAGTLAFAYFERWLAD